MKPLNILFTASEAEPLVKIGGLADVAGSFAPRPVGIAPRKIK